MPPPGTNQFIGFGCSGIVPSVAYTRGSPGMKQIEKTVFISYRRTNIPWALAIFQNLTQSGFDVFVDYSGIRSGDFEHVILQNIHARAHFLVLLTPSALERCEEPEDLLRREIEAALDGKRNIVPLMLEGFDFGAPAIAKQLTGKLSLLKKYNALNIPADFFAEAMGRLRDRFLNVPLKAVLHPASRSASRAAKEEKGAATKAPVVAEKELTAQQWFERGFDARDLDEKLRLYSQAIRLKPDYAEAFYNRGRAHHDKDDLKAATQDYSEAIRLRPDFTNAFNNRGCARYYLGDLDGALEDYNETVRLEPKDGIAYGNRGEARRDKGDLKGALQDCNRAVRFKPDHAEAFCIRGTVHRAQGNLRGALRDFDAAINLQPNYAEAEKGRDTVLKAIAQAHKSERKIKVRSQHKAS